MLNSRKSKPSILLHICCVGCGAYVSDFLKTNFEVVLYFFNPNIFPKEEYDVRLKETERIANKFSLKLIIGDYNHENWLNKIKGHEADSERGKRCRICYQHRLEVTACLAKEKNIKYFTSTLSVSPHKDANAIKTIGKKLEEKYNLKFLDNDFKKNNGFKKAVKFSKDLNLYRQNYCGCEFSWR
ncbi:epoxyqueuosine reductase QueH [Candidatus Parcubacteria bacterium]|nr:epoxyqueuosine reductase QueH [Candidatus Parcubacteria bacterium]